jgi:hypothetical protein
LRKSVSERLSPWRSSRRGVGQFSAPVDRGRDRPGSLSYLPMSHRPAAGFNPPRYDSPASPHGEALPARSPSPPADACRLTRRSPPGSKAVAPPSAFASVGDAPPIRADHFLEFGAGHGGLEGLLIHRLASRDTPLGEIRSLKSPPGSTISPRVVRWPIGRNP